MLEFFRLSQSDQSPLLPDEESVATINPASLSPWDVIRDGTLDVVAALSLPIAAASVILLSCGSWRSAIHGHSISALSIVGNAFLAELSFLYFGFRRLKVNRKRGTSLRLLEGKTGRGILSGVSAGMALIAVSLGYSNAIQQSARIDPVQLFADEKANLPLRLALVLIISVLAPTCEEIFFRAGIFGSAQAINRAGLGAVVASVLFALVHVSLVLLPYYVLFSLTMCWLFTKCRTIAGPIAAHITINAASCLGFFL